MDAASWIRLPARGLNEAPEWPAQAIDSDFPVTLKHESLWVEMWTTYPQAHIWKRNHMEFQVAAYVRLAVECAGGVAKATAFSVMRQYSADLMLTQHALRSARIVIDGQIEEPIEERTNPFGVAPVVSIDSAPSAPSVRDRLRGAAASAVATPDGSDDIDEDDESGFEGNSDGEEE